MRISILLVVLLAIAAVVGGCGGPDDPDTRLAEACERQIEEIEAEGEEGDTPTAKSTEERLEDTTLVECAGQNVRITAGGEEGEGGEGNDEDGEGTAEEGDSEGAGAGSETSPADDEGEGQIDPEARELFATSCGGCHALADAGTSGAVGPDLDETEMDAEAILAQIENGGGGMPANILEGEEAESVANYVASVAGAAGE